MKILKLIRIVVIFLMVACTPIKTNDFIIPLYHESNEIVKTSNVKESLAQQTEKEIAILNQLEKESLIATEIKKLKVIEKNEVLCLALNIYNESRGSSLEDQIATSYVVFNRLNSSDYPLTLKNQRKNICSIVFDKYQFCWTNGSINAPKEKDSWKHSQELAYKLYMNKEHLQLAKQFALKHYVVSSMLNDSRKPKWIEKRKLTIKIGKHSYMAIKEDLNDTPENRFKVKDAIQKGLFIIRNDK